MYLGLFLAPWILVYGVSGLAFHHWSWFSDWPKEFLVKFTPEQLRIPLPWPEAERLAEDAVNRMNAGSESGYVLDRGSAQLDPRISIPLSWEGGSGEGVIHVGEGAGGLRSFRPDLAPRRLAITLPVIFDQAAASNLRRDATTLFRNLEPTLREIDDIRWPALTFMVQQRDQTLLATRDLGNGVVSLRQLPGPRVPNFLTSLHKSHWNFATGPWIRTLWATLSDCVAFALIFWSVTGLIMWWQLKPSRAFGRIVLVVSIVLAMGVAYGMWHQLRV